MSPELQFHRPEACQHQPAVVGVEVAVDLPLIELEADRLLRAALAKPRVSGAVVEEVANRRQRAGAQLAMIRHGNLHRALAMSASAENVVRIAVHPADQLVASSGLAASGVTVAAIAARFGVPERIVEPRLRLGNAAPELLDACRAREIDLQTLKAFAGSSPRSPKGSTASVHPPAGSATMGKPQWADEAQVSCPPTSLIMVCTGPTLVCRRLAAPPPG